MNRSALRLLFVAAVLVLSAMPAFAVSLGQVQMQSGLGQPLLAYIPVYDAGQAELQRLDVRLAPEDAFRRLGLDRDRYRELRIELTEDENGRPVIQLSSELAFNEPVFSLLLETRVGNGVGQVKEFTALVDPPFIARAAIQTIETPAVTLTPVISAPQTPTQRTPAVSTGTRPAPPQAAKAPVKPAAKTQAPQPAAQAAVKAPPRAVSPPQAIPQIPATPGNQREVVSGESLYSVALEHQKKLGDAAINLNQMMTAIQRANSQAFIRGDRNLLKRGSVLRMPDAAQVRALLPEDSANLLNSQWARSVQAQPAPALDSANRLASAPRPAATQPPAAKPDSVTQGRLRIVPTVGNMNNAGSQSGASGAGTGSELRVEGAVSQEEYAARQVEITNLKNQLDEAAKLQAESARLIELQSTQIKQLTQRMQEIDAGAVESAASAQTDSPQQSAGSPWYSSPFALLAGLLLIAAALGFVLKRRR